MCCFFTSDSSLQSAFCFTRVLPVLGFLYFKDYSFYLLSVLFGDLGHNPKCAELNRIYFWAEIYGIALRNTKGHNCVWPYISAESSSNYNCAHSMLSEYTCNLYLSPLDGSTLCILIYNIIPKPLAKSLSHNSYQCLESDIDFG